MLQQPSAAMLNHLLAQSGWALPRLAKFSGRTVRFRILPFAFSFTIGSDGTLSPAARDASPDAVCTIPPALLPRLALLDDAALDLIEHAGDAALIEEIFFLARNLRWDAAEDLSRVTGDIAAERIVQFARGAHRHVHDTALHLAQAAAEYWTEERPLVATPRQIETLRQGIAGLQVSLDALEQRLTHLSKGR